MLGTAKKETQKAPKKGSREHRTAKKNKHIGLFVIEANAVIVAISVCLYTFAKVLYK